jgi:rhodanese-related sulfurtransferase
VTRACAARGRIVRRLAALALAGLVALPMPALAGLSLWLFGPKDWPATLALVRETYPAVKQIGTAELAAQLARGPSDAPVLIDTRTAPEFAVSHIASARHAETLEQARAIVAAAPPGRPVVLYCSVGYRSSALADKLVRAGMPNVANLEGSLFAWANEGRPVVTGGATPVKLVHPYDRRWAKLLKPELRATP